jgi:sulfoxide reductase heme-binding subunit YedZ
VNGELTWDLARAAGLVAYGLLTASVALGLALSLGWRSARWNRFVTNEIHRFATLMALLFVGLHGVAILLDPFIAMGPADVLVPFVTTYRPAWVGFGILAGYLVAAVYLSERVRGRIGYAWWRRFHATAFVAFVLALVHGLATGSDTRAPWALGLYAVTGGLVVALLGLRLLPPPPSRRRHLSAAVVVATMIAIAAFAVTQPLQPGWSARAGGTLPSAMAGQPRSAGLGVTVSEPLSFDGAIARGEEALQVTGTTKDGSAAFRLQLVAEDEEAIRGAVVLQTGTDQVCEGAVTSVGNTTIDATCQTTAGESFSFRMAVIDISGTTITGTLELTPRS